METFLRNEADIVFALKEQTKQVPGIQVHDLFESKIYLIANRDDPIAEKNLISEEDLCGRTLMVGGGSPSALRAVQHRLIGSEKINYFNSARDLCSLALRTHLMPQNRISKNVLGLR